jgi:radical SAM protein with 4Fe4S-binding SPASM domain
MDILKSHREMDYNKLSGNKKGISFFIKRGDIFSQITDRMKWYLAPKFFYVVKFPTHLDIEASFACQMRCPMCLRQQMTKDLTYNIMDFDLYKKIIDEAVRRGVYSIKLSWRGEPLLNPRIVDMVKYAKNMGVKDVAFLTNGERLNPKLSRGLVDAGLDWLSFSIDGMGEIYDRIRWPSTFEGITEKVKYLKGYRDGKGLNKPLIRIQTIWGAVKHNPEGYFNYWERFAEKVFIIADQIRADLVTNFKRDENYICKEPWRRVTIGWDGKVSQCIADYDELNVLGDVKKQSIYDLWHGERFNKLRESIKNRKIFTNKSCTSCHDPGKMIQKVIKIRDREIKIGLYKGQELDVSKMDARPKREVKK